MKNPLSIEAFADWAAMQPAEERYSYTDVHGCAFCQYLKVAGLPVSTVDPITWSERRGDRIIRHKLPDGVNEAVRARPWTFGALAKRLRS